jgi:HEAT repeat protein
MPDPPEAAARRRRAAAAGHRRDETAARQDLTDADPGVRATALGALARMGRMNVADVHAALGDPAPAVRRRACEAAARSPDAVALAVSGAVLAALDDPDPTVTEVAAWALGELSEAAPLPPTAVAALSTTATVHRDPLCREAAVAALGAIGDPEGLAAVLAGTTDKPAVRRRAVLALANFDGPDVDAAMARALSDRDWQVRQAAEDLSRASDPPP